MVQSGRCRHLRGKLPGFASGGLVSWSRVCRTRSAARARGVLSAEAQAVTQQLANAIKKAQAAQVAAQRAAVGGGTLGSGTSAGLLRQRGADLSVPAAEPVRRDKVAAAGATASIWGESGFNPYAFEGFGGASEAFGMAWRHNRPMPGLEPG